MKTIISTEKFITLVKKDINERKKFYNIENVELSISKIGDLTIVNSDSYPIPIHTIFEHVINQKYFIDRLQQIEGLSVQDEDIKREDESRKETIRMASMIGKSN